VDDKGHYRTVSPVFRAIQSSEPFAVGEGYNYGTVHAGDYVTQSLTEKDEGRLEFVKCEWLNKGFRRWLLSTEDGEILDEKPYGMADSDSAPEPKDKFYNKKSTKRGLDS
jgi:hypothetical protein